MTLRGRLLLIVALVNLLALAVAQLTAIWVHDRTAETQRLAQARTLQTLLRLEVYSDQPLGKLERVRRLLTRSNVYRTMFRDVILTDSVVGIPGQLDLNPLGAANRPPDFPLDDVRRGIDQAIDTGALIQVAGGVCVELESLQRKQGDEPSPKVLAGAWFLPRVEPRGIPFAALLIPVLLSTLLFGALVSLTVEHSVLRPLQALVHGSARVGEGDLSARVPRASSIGGDFEVLIDSFNSMAARIEGHTEELKREVEAATEAAARRERALVMSSRLAAMGTLAAGIAHEINNPIGGMLNAVVRLQKKGVDEERAQVYLELLREGLDRVGGIARRVLDFSPRTLAAAPFSVREAVDGAKSLIAHRLKRCGFELVIELAEDLPSLYGDRGEIQQVVLNLLINSLDAMEEAGVGSRIRVESARAESGAGELEIVVSDDGPGAPAETLERVFDPFFSSKGRPDATGLGMFISFSIVQNHGGSMAVDSEPGKGFAVRMRLPTAPANAADLNRGGESPDGRNPPVE